MKISNLKQNKYLLLLFGIVFISAIITILLPTKKTGTTPVGNPGTVRKGTNGSSPDSSKENAPKKSFNIFNLFSKPQSNSSGAGGSTEQNSNETNSMTGGSTDGTISSSYPSFKKLSDNQTSTSQGTITYNADVQKDITSNTKKDDIKITFQNPDGSTFVYIPPGTPPDEVRWARYVNHNDKYSLNFPSNWQFFYSIDNGHEGVALYPPGTNPKDLTTPYLGFGVTDSFLLPGANNTNRAFITPIVVDGLNGKLYTNGALGNSYIASAISYSGRFFGLGSSKSTTTFAYIYYYMINSLKFNIE